ncbi:MAG: SDR family oxidoreductase [Candidatus Promineifilaceae bacterium]|nr:SDR family oxidoreductase [Candidatus Promineifilaceae bacterium]
MFDFSKQIVLITGASGNLGRATGRAFQEAGATLVLAARNLDHLEAAFPDLADAGDHLFVTVDLTDPGTVEAMAYEVIHHLGRVDVLVNIAGGFQMGPAVHETPLEQWDKMMNLNLRSVIHTSRALVPHMLEQGHGAIINIGASRAAQGRAKMAPWAVSKDGVLRLTESMSAELKMKGIRVNCVMPDTLDTPENRQAMPKANFDKWASPEAVAEVICFLASDAALVVHGSGIPVSGPG